MHAGRSVGRVTGAAFVCLSLATAAGEPAQDSPGTQAAALMRQLYADLDPQVISHGSTDFAVAERFLWGYELQNRRGLPLFDLDTEQRRQLWEVLGVLLSERGLEHARDVPDLEAILRTRTNDPGYDPEAYALTVFGVPGERGRWGLRFEGHHLSLHFTFIDGQVASSTPMAFGAQPARLDRTSRHAEIAPFAAEETAVQRLLDTLDPVQTRLMVFANRPPDNLLSGTGRRAARPVLLGIRYDELEADQQTLLLALVESHAARLAPALAVERMATVIGADLTSLRFGWAGSTEPGAPRYYRVHGNGFMLEYGTIDGDVQHVHSAWRDFDNDFGNRAVREAAERPLQTTMTPSTTGSSSMEPGRPLVRTLPEPIAENGCTATADVVARRWLTDEDRLPRALELMPGLEALTLRLTTVSPQPGLANLCIVGAEIEAISPRHPDSRLVGKRVGLRLEQVGDRRVHAWQALAIRPLGQERE